MNLVTWLQRTALRHPQSMALFQGREPWATHGELASSVARLAAGLRGRAGLAPGDRVAICMKNAPEYLQALYGIWWAGLVAVPVNAKLHAKEVDYIVADSGARVVIDSAGALASLAGDAPLPLVERAPADLAWLFYTSGTTGRPKGAMLSHRNLATMTDAYFSTWMQ